MAIDVLKPNKNTGLSLSEPGATRIFPGAYDVSTVGGASFTVTDSDGTATEFPAGTSSVFLPKGATSVSSVSTPLPSTWTSGNLPATFASPRGACTFGGNGYVIDSLSSIYKTTDYSSWTRVREGTPGAELIHAEVSGGNGTYNQVYVYPEDIRANDVSIIVIYYASTQTNYTTPTGYTLIRQYLAAADSHNASIAYKILDGTETEFAYDYNQTYGDVMSVHYVVRGISDGSAPSFVEQTFSENIEGGNQYFHPASITPVSAGAFGISFSTVENSYAPDNLSDLSNLGAGYESSQYVFPDHYDHEWSQLINTGISGTTTNLGAIAVGASVLTNAETFTGPIPWKYNYTTPSTDWISHVIVFEPVASAVTSGFAASDIAASSSEIVAVDKTFGKTLRSTDGTTWVDGTVADAAPAAPTVVWTDAWATSTASFNAGGYTFPTGTPLQNGDLVIVTVGYETSSMVNAGDVEDFGWRAIDIYTESPNSAPSPSDLVIYKVVDDDFEAGFNLGAGTLDFNISGSYIYFNAIAIRGASADLRFSRYTTTGGVPNPPALAMSEGSLSVAMAYLVDTSYIPDYPAGYTGDYYQYAGTIMQGYKEITTAGAEDPAAFIDPNGVASNKYIARTIEVKSAENAGALASLVWDGSRFVGVGDGVFESADGTTWNKLSEPNATTKLTKIVFEDGEYLVGDRFGRAYRSSDGETWTEALVASFEIANLAKQGTYFVTDVTGATYKSSDFVTWTKFLPGEYGVEVFATTYNSGEKSVNFTAETGDLVVAWFCNSTTTDPEIAESGWTRLGTAETQTNFSYTSVYYKYMGATPDTSVSTTLAAWGGDHNSGIIVWVVKNTNSSLAPTWQRDIDANRPAAGLIQDPTPGAFIITVASVKSSNLLQESYLYQGIRNIINPFFYKDDDIRENPLALPKISTTSVWDGYAAFQLHTVPRYATSDLDIAGGQPFWTDTGTRYYTVTDIIIPMEDARYSGSVISGGTVAVLERGGELIAKSSSSKTEVAVATDFVGESVVLNNGQQRNILTGSGKLFQGGSKNAGAVLTSKG